ncbi:MAG: DNA mismatch repair protein MutS [Bacteroides sp.]|nr:DNA mismatch repair protein MutS [Bacteroides sp.]MCM1448198.1 DNA mismatch repair protein MutS [Bacteroides sp.]
MAKEVLTPMMKQFYDLKEQHPECILLFRCGDFYETYGQDAVTASGILGITLTRRSNGAGGTGQLEMAGFPYHALDTYLPRLVRAGMRVAVCDQLEDPKLAKKLVKRGITELVTPGVAMQDNLLSGKENNYLAAVHFGKGTCGVAFLDISTGEFLTSEGSVAHVGGLLSNFSPKEVLYERGKGELFRSSFAEKFATFEMDDWVFSEQTARGKLLKHFGVKNLKGYGIEHMRAGTVACGVVMQYLENTQHTQLSHIRQVARIEEDRYVHMDHFTMRSLELLHPMNHDGKSLMDVMGRTTTPMGARMLGKWMVFPLKDPKAINSRLDVVEYFFRDIDTRDTVGEQLRYIGDMERIISRISTGRVSPRELLTLSTALQALKPIHDVLVQTDSPVLCEIGNSMELCEEMRDRLQRTISPDAPLLLSKGGVIASGVCEELDELHALSTGGKEYLLKLQQTEAERTGIQSLKIGYNNVFGYYLEVRNTYKNQVPQEWIRKQTLVSAERYITQELKEYEEKIVTAEERISILENQLFGELVSWCARFIPAIQADARLVARLDCLLSFAILARENRYIRPMVDDSMELDIRKGRHPVIETQMNVGEHYVPNDVRLDTDHQQVIIITGPNMAGKSALLRQTALITLMAQMGSFVPAESAHIGYVDKIFTRVGASDNISLGESTFMVEMNEAAAILNNLSPRSLVLFDELGRGTSTYDGISIAWSIVEYIHENSRGRARTLFATHYHELNEMEKSFPRVHNYNVSVLEKDGGIIFLRKLEPGGSAHSFGIHVARLAGMPQGIVQRADIILRQLEQEKRHDNVGAGIAAGSTKDSDTGTQLSFFQLDDPILEDIRQQLLHIDINSLTPLEALNKLNDIKRLVKEG